MRGEEKGNIMAQIAFISSLFPVAASAEQEVRLQPIVFLLSFCNTAPSTILFVLESKAPAAETAIRVTDLGMQTCGGAAFSRHLTVERNFRDARAMSVMAPTLDVLQDFIGRALCGMPLF